MNVAKYLILLLSTCLILVQADCNKSNDTNHTLSCNPIKQQTAYVTVRAPLPNTTYGNQVFSENYCVEFQTTRAFDKNIVNLTATSYDAIFHIINNLSPHNVSSALCNTYLCN